MKRVPRYSGGAKKNGVGGGGDRLDDRRSIIDEFEAPGPEVRVECLLVAPTYPPTYGCSTRALAEESRGGAGGGTRLEARPRDATEGAKSWEGP